MSTRYFKKKFPNHDDIVIVKVGISSENGFRVNLLEYNNLEGFVNESEIANNRSKKKNPIREGEILPMVVVRVDEKKQQIDLSKKKVSIKEVEEIMKNYKYSSYLNKIGLEIFNMYQNFYEDLNETLEMDHELIMNNTIWRLYELQEDDTSYKIYTEILQNPTKIFNEDFSTIFINSAVNNITKKIIRGNITKEIDFSLVVTEKDGINILKKLLNVTNTEEQKQEHKQVQVQIFVNSPPIYRLKIEGSEQNLIDDVMQKVLDNISQNVKNYNNIEFNIIDKSKVIKESILSYKFSA